MNGPSNRLARGSWTALAREDPRPRLEVMRERFLKFRPQGLFVRATALGGASNVLAESVALLGGRAARPYFDPLLDALDPMLAEVEAEHARVAVMQGAMWFVHLARCCGCPVSEYAVARVSDWVRAMDMHPEWLHEGDRESLHAFRAWFTDAPPPAVDWPAALREFPLRVAAGAPWSLLFGLAATALVARGCALADVGGETHKQIMQLIGLGD